jgi:hypothetical protein
VQAESYDGVLSVFDFVIVWSCDLRVLFTTYNLLAFCISHTDSGGEGLDSKQQSDNSPYG